MKFRLCLSSFVAISFFLVQNAKAQDPIQYGIPYDTAYLKNETKLIYSKTDKSRIIRIINPAVDTILFSTSIHRDADIDGRVKADFESCVVLYYGSGAYEGMGIYNKQNGKLIAGGAVVAFDTIKEVMIYADGDKIDLLYLYDLKNSKLEKYFTPSTNCLSFWYCIQVKAITDTQFTIEYYAKNTNIKTKKTFTRPKPSP